METILAWDSTSHGGKPEGYLHLTCEQRCQIYALLQSGHSQAHIARQIGVDPSTISRELVRNTGARGYRFKQAHEKASQKGVEEASDKPRKMTARFGGAVVVPIRSAGVWRRMASPVLSVYERIYQHVWKDKKDGGTLYLHLRHSGKKYNRRKGKNSGRRADSEPRRHRSAASYCRRKKPHRRLGGRHDYRRQSQRRCHVARRANLQIHQARQTAGQERGLCRRTACARVLLPLADRIETITYDNGKEFASHAQIATSLGALSYLPSPITRGNAASTNTLTASSGSTSQKVPTSLFCPMPMSKGSRTSQLSPQKDTRLPNPSRDFLQRQKSPVALHC